MCLVLMSGIVACEFHIHPLERRAIKITTDLVVTPEPDDAKLVGNDPQLFDGIVLGTAEKNTIRYLRVRQTQGIDIKIELGSRTVIDSDHQIVVVLVAEPGDGAVTSKQQSYPFNLDFNKDKNNAWQLTEVSAAF